MSRSIDVPIETTAVIFAGTLSLTNKLRYISDWLGGLTISRFVSLARKNNPGYYSSRCIHCTRESRVASARRRGGTCRLLVFHFLAARRHFRWRSNRDPLFATVFRLRENAIFMARHRWLRDGLTYSGKGTTLACKVSVPRAERLSHWPFTTYTCRKWSTIMKHWINREKKRLVEKMDQRVSSYD